MTPAYEKHLEATKRTVYLSNLSYRRDRAGIKSLLAPFGQILNIKIVTDNETGYSKGMAFVEFKTVQEARSTIAALHNHSLDGRTLKATWATPQRTLRPTAKTEDEKVQRDPNRDLHYREIQLMKKERNLRQRQSRPSSFV